MGYHFTKEAYHGILRLLRILENTNSASDKKIIRRKLRNYGYYISEIGANTATDLQWLVDLGIVAVEENENKTCFEQHSTFEHENLCISDEAVKSFPAVADDDSEILVLGTAPGAKSLAIGEYYAQAGNLFWNIIQEVFNHHQPFSSYVEKLNCLKKNHIALWDTLRYCQREGSADATIKGEMLNDIDNFLRNHPSIKKIIFNGRKPATYYHPVIPFFIAPSTSPANRGYMTDEERINVWKEALTTDLSK